MSGFHSANYRQISRKFDRISRFLLRLLQLYCFWQHLMTRCAPRFINVRCLSHLESRNQFSPRISRSEPSEKYEKFNLKSLREKRFDLKSIFRSMATDEVVPFKLMQFVEDDYEAIQYIARVIQESESDSLKLKTREKCWWQKLQIFASLK